MINRLAESESYVELIHPRECVQTSMLKRVAEQTEPISTVSNVIDKPAEEQVWSIPGFGAGARVQTSFGFVPVEALRLGDPLKTRTGQLIRVQYVDKIRLDRRFLLTHPEAQPITIPKDAFGASCPSRNICVSGAQEVRPPSRFDQIRGTTAVKLIGQRRIFRNLSGCFNYYVFHCGEAATACIDGLWVNLEPLSPDTSID